MKIALIGKTGSGKTTVTRYLREKHQFEICSTGKRCRELALEFFDSESKAILQKLTDAINSIKPGAWLTAAMKNIDHQAPRIVIDSIRSAEDLRLVREQGYSVWRITSPLDLRTDRLMGRGQEFDPDQDDSHSSETALATV